MAVAMSLMAAVCFWLFRRFALRNRMIGHPVQIALIPIVLDYLVAPFCIVVFNDYWAATVEFGTASEYDLAPAVLLAAIGLFSFGVGACLFDIKPSDKLNERRKGPTRLEPVSIIAIFALLALSIVATVLTVSIAGGTSKLQSVFAERRIIFAGFGYVEIIRLSGYIAVAILADRACEKRLTLRAVIVLIAASVIAGAPFLVIGQRSPALAPFFLVMLVWVIRRQNKAVLVTLILFSPLLFYVGRVTHAARNAYVLNTSFVNELAHGDQFLVPANFRHIECLACVITLKREKHDLPDTFVASFLNWLPRSIFPGKDLTTGPHLAFLLVPHWNQTGDHTSAVTTGPIVEAYYHGGVPGVVLGMFSLGMLFSKLYPWFHRLRPAIRTPVIALQAMMLGFYFWINDLGGAINKEVCLVASLLIAMFLIKTIGRIPTASRISNQRLATAHVHH
jgi:hypothetical protein